MSLVVRGKGQIETLEQIRNIFVKSIEGTPIYLKDVATVAVDTKVPNGIFRGKDREDPSVQGIVLLHEEEPLAGPGAGGGRGGRTERNGPACRRADHFVLRSDASDRCDAAHRHT